MPAESEHQAALAAAEQFLDAKAARVEAALKMLVDGWTRAPEGLLEAVRYSLFAGGKRLRPALALGAAELVGGREEFGLPLACALEMVHTYSLIHDDLPAMDDDDMRRGRPTSHKVFGEAAAILAGDTLLTMAFDVVAETGKANVVRELAQASGVHGMAGGQYLDLKAEGRQVTLEELARIHAWKTGALIRASVRGGAIAAGADAAALEALTLYGEHLGLAFQIADDLLDVVGDAEMLGKSTGSDTARGKATYPGLMGLDVSWKAARAARDDAMRALERFGPEADDFRNLAYYIVERQR